LKFDIIKVWLLCFIKKLLGNHWNILKLCF